MVVADSVTITDTAFEGEDDPLMDAVSVISVEAELEKVIVDDEVELCIIVALLIIDDVALSEIDAVEFVEAADVEVTDTLLVERTVTQLDALAEAERVCSIDCDTDNDITGDLLAEEEALTLANKEFDFMDESVIPDDAEMRIDFECIPDNVLPKEFVLGNV